MICFDLMADEKGKALYHRPLSDRRAALESVAKEFFHNPDRIVLSPAARTLKSAKEWYADIGAAPRRRRRKTPRPPLPVRQPRRHG
jgi:hypothetical protein